MDGNRNDIMREDEKTMKTLRTSEVTNGVILQTQEKEKKKETPRVSLIISAHPQLLSLSRTKEIVEGKDDQL